MSAERSRMIAGINPVIAALRSNPQSLQCLFIARDSGNQRVKDVELLARDQGIEVKRADRAQLESMTGIDRHQDVVAELCTQVDVTEADLDALLDAVEGDPLLLVLDGVTDPHNLGACLRSADGAGVHAVIVPKDRAAGLTPVARKVSAGASEVVPLVTVTNLARTLRHLKDRGIWLCGTSDQADDDLYGQDLTGPLALVMGSEGQGMRRLTSELCDFLTSVPMLGRVESLNVSVATGVCLYEIRRQRNTRK